MKSVKAFIDLYCPVTFIGDAIPASMTYTAAIGAACKAQGQPSSSGTLRSAVTSVRQVSRRSYSRSLPPSLGASNAAYGES
jgi:hypothetical protein